MWLKLLGTLFVTLSLCSGGIIEINPDRLSNAIHRMEQKIDKWLWETKNWSGSARVDPGDPLILTPMLEAGKIKQAQEMALVELPEAPHVVSYSGFLTVNPDYNSNMFFWYFPALSSPETAPLVIWLQGGPGGSSLFGLFVENGPFQVTSKGDLKMRQTSWTANHNVIYIDNPVGTGFSFTKDDKGYSRNETDVAENLFKCVVQLFSLFPHFQSLDLFITGESYAGKYVPALTYRIHQSNKAARDSGMRGINLKGMAIGDGLMDPATQNDYGAFLYNIGLINANQKKVFDSQRKVLLEQIQNKQWDKAFETFDNLLNGDLNGKPSTFTNFTGYHYYFNYLISDSPADLDYFSTYLERNTTRKGIHVGRTPYNDGSEAVEKHLLTDMMQSVKPWIEEIINNQYRVLIYNGQLDVIIANSLTQAFIDSLDFKGKKDFTKAPRKIWRVGDDLAGYSITSGNFTQVMVRDAGHLIPYDQPIRAFDMITRFTHGKKF